MVFPPLLTDHPISDSSIFDRCRLLGNLSLGSQVLLDARGFGALLRLEERPVSLDLAISHGDKPEHDSDPVDVVRDDRAVRGRVGPSQDGVEETPASASVELRAAALMIPVRPCLSLSLER